MKPMHVLIEPEPEPEPDLYSKKILKYTRKCKFYRYNKEKFLLFQDKEIFLVILNKEDFLVILDNEDTQDKEMAFVNHLLAKRGLTVVR